ncbi:hypothetical protein PVK06_047492 [Gossypium arboreum]|uniref:Uncharacterized protein n=1 Tax=Gossypium arboreum TaxID=29729 RepID=A0ABR0MDJ5_GOSAR|nr:hypothetical protein PVK06_047492 [Gossypium arboreum]
MSPRKSRRTSELEPSVVATPSNFPDLNVEKFCLKLQGKMFIQKQGFELSMILCREIWTLVQYHRWECFCVTPKDFVVVQVVQELYASLRDQESSSLVGNHTSTVEGSTCHP